MRAASHETTSLQARKPYTITKQREKWTDQEHARFLDALRLYGRAWRRIEGAFLRLLLLDACIQQV